MPRMKDGFRRRGDQVTRLEAFVDAAFAFAVTLLVISIDAVPDSLEALLLALRGIPAFAFGFALIALFWYLHARWSRRYGMDDVYSNLLGLLLVFLVLVYVYPLKLLSGLMFASFTGHWLPSPIELTSYEDLRAVFVVYGLAFCTLAACVSELYAHALRRRRQLQLEREEAAQTAGDVAVWRLAVLIGLLSVSSALLVPAEPPVWLAGLPGFVYFLMNLAWPVSAWAARRTRARLAAEAT
jgi:uncharacterized membrane protein